MPIDPSDEFPGADRVKVIREQIDQSKNRKIELLEQQIEQFKDQIENLHRHLDETREEHRGYMRLLEDKREEQGKAYSTPCRQ